MEKPKLIPQIYGYAVCLVSVITFLISVTVMVNSIIDLSDPLHANSSFMAEKSASLASYDLYKVETLKSVKTDAGTTTSSYLPDEKTLHSMYETARADKIRSETHQIIRTVVVNSLLIIICIVLFITHWRWMRKLSVA
jgi:hypothetical protein